MDMKRYLLYMLLTLWNVSFFTACFDDKSTDADHPIPDIVIDTTGIPETLKVVQNGRLSTRCFQVLPYKQATLQIPRVLLYR